MRLERRPTPNSEPGRGGERPLAIVVHTSVGTYEGTCAWFATERSRVCSHYLVALDGRVAQFVDERDTARHAGRVRDPSAALVRERGGNPNRYTVGIEFEDGGDPEGVARPDAQYACGAALIATIAGRWQIPLDRDHVLGHREIFAAKTCPANLDVERLIAAARELAAGPSG